MATRSPAWLHPGLAVIPGHLLLAGGRLRFTAFHSGSATRRQLQRLAAGPGAAPDAFARLLADEPALLFNAPLEELRIDFPWYYFSAGFKVFAGGICYHIGLGPPAVSGGTSDLALAAEDLRNLVNMRRVGLRWRAVLADAIR